MNKEGQRIMDWIDTGNGEAIRWKKRSGRAESVRIKYLVPDSQTDGEVLFLNPGIEPALVGSAR